MNQGNLLQELAPILQSYSVEPYFAEDFGSVKKIYSNKGTFALKKIDPHYGADFIRHIQYLYQKGFNRIVPVYPAIDGRYGILFGKDLYYLMPWMANEIKEGRSERHQQLFRELARLHTLSAKEIKVEKEKRTSHYENMIEQYEKNQEFLEGFIESCERKTYMSPFELQYCLYYSDISQALKFSKKKLEEWYESTKDQEKARMVMVHGKISTEHFLFNEQGYGYFINFENAGYGSPIHDLLPFLSRALDTPPRKNEEAIDWINHYLTYFPFKPDERLLFYSYLAYPGKIIKAAETYFTKKSVKKEMKNSAGLLKEYWHLKNTEYIVMRLAELDSQQQATQEGAQEN